MSLYASNFEPWVNIGDHSTLYYLNYTVGFEINGSSPTNMTSLFTNMPQGPPLAASSYSGYMFADNYELWTYGGLANVPGDTAPASDYIAGYQVYEDQNILTPVLGPDSPGTVLTSPVTRYLTNGAGVNIPDEKLGFYFSGVSGSPAIYNSGFPQTLESSLLKVDMSTEGSPLWSQTSLGDNVQARADAQLVWIPVGTNGALIAIGGVISPEELFDDALNETQVQDSERTTFMTTLAVYDIFNAIWYQQPVSGHDSPGLLTQFCSVMVSETGSSTYEIYIYGGYNGLVGEGVSPVRPSDDVWVLSIPSFTWTKVYAGTGPGRRGHFCTAPYPDQMFVIGGQYFEEQCLDSAIKVFNTNSLKWQSSYDPSKWSEYKTPDKVASAIKAQPTPQWADQGLSNLFDTKYTKNITIFYPYPNLTPHSHHSTPIGPIVGGVVGGLAVLAGIVFMWHKKGKKNKPDPEVQPVSNVDVWRDGVPKPEPSVTTTEVDSHLEVNPDTGGYYKYEAPGDSAYRQNLNSTARPGGFAEVGRNTTRRVSSGVTASPHSPRSPGSGTFVAAEADGEERYEMHGIDADARSSGRGSGDIGARDNFRDHHLYPLSVSDNETRSQMSYGSPSQESHSAGDRGVPSPYMMARPPSSVVENGNGNANAELPASPIVARRPDFMQHTRNISSISSGLPQVSPPLEQTGAAHRQTDDDGLDALEAFHTGSPPAFRPAHNRNLSSLSDGINQLPSPQEEITEEERHRQSRHLSGLPSPGDESTEERSPLMGGGVQVGNETYSASSYSRGSTLGGTRSPTSRKPVGGLGIDSRAFGGKEGIAEERQKL